MSLTEKEYALRTVEGLPSAQLETHGKRTETHSCDLINRQAAIDVAFDIFPDDEYFREQFVKSIEALPSVQPEQDREFIKLTDRNSNGRPYYSIIYLELDDNGVGHDFEGYSSYSLDVISDYLKKYFMPSVQPETCDTCKHGYFGDDCDNCCVGYPNRYERRTDE